MIYARFAIALALTILFVLTTVVVRPAAAQTREEGPWWPHPIWGKDDQSGGSNWITPEKVLKALTLVKTGQIYEIGQVYSADMPSSASGPIPWCCPVLPRASPWGRTT